MEVVNEQRKKIHPHKFTLWVALGSIVMMFAGLTSAVVVKKDQLGWTTFSMPTIAYVRPPLAAKTRPVESIEWTAFTSGIAFL